MKTLFVFLLFSIYLYANFTLDSEELFQLSSDEKITLLTDLNISTKATLKADANNTINIASNWINNGDFIGTSSTLFFTGSKKSFVYGNNTFYNLQAVKSIVFESNKTQKIENELVLKDGEISSTLEGTQSIMDLSLAKNIDTENLEIQDSKIIGLTQAINPLNSIDNGNNILWFSTIIDCQNIDSDISWIDKFSCNQTDIEYIVENDSSKSKVIFDEAINDEIKEIQIKSIDNRKGVNLIYENMENITNNCGKDIKVVLYEDGTSLTGYESDKSLGCTYEDSTLENWGNFKDSAEIYILKTTSLEKNKHESSNSVIVIDINLTKKLLIKGKSYEN